MPIAGSMFDVKLFKFAGGRKRIQIDFPYKAGHSAVQGLNHLIHLLIGAFHDQFNSSVGEIFYVAADVVLKCDVLSSVTEADALNSTAEITLATMRTTGSISRRVRRWRLMGFGHLWMLALQ
jgi:hypothetical protein